MLPKMFTVFLGQDKSVRRRKLQYEHPGEAGRGTAAGKPPRGAQGASLPGDGAAAPQKGSRKGILNNLRQACAGREVSKGPWGGQVLLPAQRTAQK